MPRTLKLCTICGLENKNKDSRTDHRRCENAWSDISHTVPGKRTCAKCFKKFEPKDSSQVEHQECSGNGELPKYYQSFKKTRVLPSVTDLVLPAAAPMKQAVFDLETWGLDRTWGVVMQGTILVHGNDPLAQGKDCEDADQAHRPTLYEFSLRDYPSWPEKRSDDSYLVADILSVLEDCQILYAHNGNKFDIPYLNASALKYGMPPLIRKLVDPVQVARNKFRLGSNALAAIGSFLGVQEEKLNIPADVWKTALLDNNPESWELLKARCLSDVLLLNEVARRVAPFVGMVDYRGSAYR
jgi:DNA polymerase III epsilon subunit-like protein